MFSSFLAGHNVSQEHASLSYSYCLHPKSHAKSFHLLSTSWKIQVEVLCCCCATWYASESLFFIFQLVIYDVTVNHGWCQKFITLRHEATQEMWVINKNQTQLARFHEA